MAQEGSDIIAAGELLKVLSAPTRLAIVVALDERPCRVHELVERLGLSQPLVSQHLRVLRNARLVRPERNGREATYSLVDRHVAHIASDAIRHAGEEAFGWRAGDGRATLPVAGERRPA